MNKSELINTVAKKSGLTKKDAGVAVNTFVNVVKSNVSKGVATHVTNFGTFKVNKRAPRMGRNPQTGKPLRIGAKKVVSFKAGKGLKRAANK